MAENSQPPSSVRIVRVNDGRYRLTTPFPPGAVTWLFMPSEQVWVDAQTVEGNQEFIITVERLVELTAEQYNELVCAALGHVWAELQRRGIVGEDEPSPSPSISDRLLRGDSGREQG